MALSRRAYPASRDGREFDGDTVSFCRCADSRNECPTLSALGHRRDRPVFLGKAQVCTVSISWVRRGGSCPLRIARQRLLSVPCLPDHVRGRRGGLGEFGALVAEYVDGRSD